jgi:hypothetical protein
MQEPFGTDRSAAENPALGETEWLRQIGAGAGSGVPTRRFKAKQSDPANAVFIRATLCKSTA